MPRTVTTETTVYTWEELSDAAKDTARERWSRFLWDDGSMHESMTMIWEDKLTEAGWINLADLTYDLYSQGGYPAWSGDLPEFEHDGHTYTVTVSNGHRRTSIDVEDADGTGDDTFYGSPEWPAYVARIKAAEEAARSHVHSLSSELLYAFRAEDEYQTSDEVMAETSEANGYEYTEDGKLA